MKKITQITKEKKFNDEILKNLYNKSYIRGNVLNKANSLIMDTDSCFYSSFLDEKILFGSNSTGFSVNTINSTYVSKVSNNIKFNSEIRLVSTDYKTLISSLEKVLTLITKIRIKKELIHKRTLFLLKPVKGGFKCYSDGIIGFISLKTVKILFFKFYFLLNFFSVLKKFNFIKSINEKNYITRFFISNLKFVIYSQFRKKKYVKRFNKSKVSNSFNVIFL